MEATSSLQRSQESHYKSKAICLVVLSAYWYTATCSSDPSQFTGVDLFFTSLLLAAVLCVQAWVLSLARHRRSMLDLLAGFFAACNIDALYLSVAFEYLWQLDWYAHLALFGLAWLVATLFFNSFANGKYWRKLLIVLPAALFALQVAAMAHFHLERLWAQKTQPGPEQTASAGGMTSSSNVRLVEFTRTPNVYFLSFDAMLPEALASELLGLLSLPYARTLEDKGFLRFVNYFSDTSHTESTFASMNAFDPQYDYDVRKINTGYERSPLREVFRSNGYQIHLYAKDTNFGSREKGENLDTYEAANLLFNACFSMVNKPAYALYGYCYFLHALRNKGYSLKYYDAEIFAGFFLNGVARQLEKGGRHFFIAYFKVPGHADNIRTPGQLAEFSETFKRDSVIAAGDMEKIVAFVREHDPGAWLFFFSDHGTIMFGSERDNEVGKRKRVLDNYGGLAAFYPPQACQEHFIKRQWSNTSMITRDIVRCLAGGVDPFVNEVTYGKVEDEVDLADFLYE